MKIVWDLFIWAVMVYLVYKVAYNDGRKSKWEEMCRDYICIHKSVCIKSYGKRPKNLDKLRKKR